MQLSERVRHCKICDQDGHTPFTCPRRARKPLANTRKLKATGKYHRRWQATKRQWFKDHPAEEYICYLCGRRMTREETTLDHVRSRTRAPELRYEQSNLRPSCWPCNEKKGSRDVEEVRLQKGLHIWGNR